LLHIFAPSRANKNTVALPPVWTIQKMVSQQLETTTVLHNSRRVEQFFVRVFLSPNMDLDKVGGMARHLSFEAQMGEKQ
jgi:hypothetical protein